MTLTQPMTALLADDESHVRLFMKTVLSGIGIKVIAEASDGAEAVTQYRAHRPDIAFLDINMPRTSGREALVSIRSEFPNAFVIMLTSLVNAGEVEACLDAGASHYIRKDTALPELRAEIQSACAERRHAGDGEEQTS